MATVYPNPFDFEKPVKDPKLFAGRRTELDEIDYYLELAISATPSFHNLSLIGQRAAGKTSMINMIKYMAEKKGLLAVKVSLNNDLSANDVLLFKELFDGIMTHGVQKGMFDGISGKAYRGFRKLVDTLELEVEFPLLFGTAYIGAKKDLGKSSKDSGISQFVLTHDLKKMYDEAKSKSIPAIVLLLDECDVLASNETLLQKIRNVFSDVDGYVLIFSGTEKMFPAMTETFSPIPRLFKRIDIQNFKTVVETKECILSRLKDEERTLINDKTINEIHQITNGSPYEVQLICHHMYKKFKEKVASNIVLNTEVLDSVMHELERLRSGGHHEIADRIKRCRVDELNVLRGILEFPASTPQQLAKFVLLSEVETTNVTDFAFKISILEITINKLRELCILRENQGKLQFAGDQFDNLYMRYHLFSNGITGFMIGIPGELDTSVSHKVAQVLMQEIETYQHHVKFDRVIFDEGLGRNT